MSTLPTYTQEMDDEFITIGLDIQSKWTDNINEATVVMAALTDAGCMRPQNGNTKIERTVGYGQQTAYGFGKGDVLSVDEADLDTVALFPWKYYAVPMKRSFIDDQTYSGPMLRRDYVERKMVAARQALVTLEEDIVMADDIHPDLKEQHIQFLFRIPAA